MYVADAIKNRCSVHLVYSVPCPFSTKLDLPLENVKLIQIRQALSYSNCCGGKTVSVTYFECVFVALVIRHATRMRHILPRGLPRSKIFFPISHKRYVFRK
jgi:hypothetical protein